MKVIALGMGMQSTALYLMSSMGQFERADHAIFSDPMAEHPDTYKLVDWLWGGRKIMMEYQFILLKRIYIKT